MPILTSKNELLGTFATYYRTPATPALAAQKNLARAAALVALAIIRQRDTESHQALSGWHQALFSNHPDGVFTFDLNGHVQDCNTALEKITGYSADNLHGLHFNLFVEPDYRSQTQLAFDRARNGEAITYETMGTHAAGHPYFLEITNFPINIQGEIVGVYGLCRDITDRKRQEADLRLLKRGIEASPSGMLMVDAHSPDMPVIYANPAFSEMTGYEHDEVIGRNCRFLQGKHTAPEILDAIRYGLRHRREINVELINYRKDGTPFWNHLLISPVFDKDGLCTHFIGTQQDITQQKEQEAQITYQATHDLLTGLPNAVSFQEALRNALVVCGKSGGSVGVLYLDLNGFKPINDEVGHHVGNEVLITIARRLTDLTAPEANVARLVGDEFGLLIPNYGSRKEVIELAERILVAVEQPIDTDGQMVHISASIGIACNCTPLGGPHELLQFAAGGFGSSTL